MTRRGSSASRSPSPMKLMVSTARKIAAAGEQRPVRRDVQIVLGVEQDAAPGRNVRRKAKTEKRQRRFGDDGGGHVDRAGDDHRPKRVRQDVAHHHAKRRGAERACRLDELLLAQREELRAHQPCHDHPAKGADRRDDEDEDAELRPHQRLQRVAEQVDDQQQHRQRRQRQEQVGQPHQRGIDAAARHAGDRARRWCRRRPIPPSPPGRRRAISVRRTACAPADPGRDRRYPADAPSSAPAVGR